MRWTVVAWLLLTAVAVTACGGSAAKKKSSTSVPTTAVSTVAAAGPTSTDPATTTTTGAHHSKASATRHTTHKSAHKATAGNSTGAGSNGTPTNSDPPSPPKSKGPSPAACLTRAGLTRARYDSQGQWWEANVGNTSATDANGMVFVDGPYKSKSAADKSTVSIQAVEYGARGGLYVVSATYRSKLRAKVQAVASCLNGRHRASKSYTF